MNYLKNVIGLSLLGTLIVLYVSLVVKIALAAATVSWTLFPVVFVVGISAVLALYGEL